MSYEKIFQMPFSDIYQLLTNKVLRKGHTEQEVLEIIQWLTGYQEQEIKRLMNTDIKYADFFKQAPTLNPSRFLIKGTICGVRVEAIEDPLIRDIRYLDKLIDELAKGKPMEKILRS